MNTSFEICTECNKPIRGKKVRIYPATFKLTRRYFAHEECKDRSIRRLLEKVV